MGSHQWAIVTGIFSQKLCKNVQNCSFFKLSPGISAAFAIPPGRLLLFRFIGLFKSMTKFVIWPPPPPLPFVPGKCNHEYIFYAIVVTNGGTKSVSNMTFIKLLVIFGFIDKVSAFVLKTKCRANMQ